MKKKFISLAMSCAFVINMLAPMASAQTLLSGWSTEAVAAATNNGLLTGDQNGNLMLEKHLTRGEMATVVNRSFNATEKASLEGFSDVDSEKWYYSEMAKAVYMKTFLGDDTRLSPNASITRQEAFLVLARALSISPIALSSHDAEAIFTDATSIAPWARGYVLALAKAGIVQGADGMINPTDNITREEFAQLMFNSFKMYITKAATVTSVVKGNIMVNVSDVVLKDVTVYGDLIIGDGVGEGDFTLENTKVLGRLVVRGGGTNSIKVNGTSSISQAVSNKSGDFPVSIKVANTATLTSLTAQAGNLNISGSVGSVNVDSTGKTSLNDAKVSNLTVTAASNINVGKGSTVSNVSVNAPNATLTVSGSIDTVTTAKEAQGAKIETTNTAKIQTVVAQGDGTVVSGSGNVTSVKAEGNNTTVNTDGTRVDVSEAVTGTTAGGKDVEAGEQVIVKPNEPTPTPPVQEEDVPTTPSVPGTTVHDVIQLAAAVKNAKSGDIINLAAGTYDITRGTDTIEGQDGWYFPIQASGITLRGIGSVTLTSTESSANGNYSSQNFITIWGDNVTLENLTIVPKDETNKTIQIIGKNSTLKDITINPNTVSRNAGSVYFGEQGSSNIGTTTLENVTINHGSITTGKATGGMLVLKNSAVNLAGAQFSQDTEGPALGYENYMQGFYNGTKLQVKAEGFAVKVSPQILIGSETDPINSLMTSLPESSKLILSSGTYDVNSLTIPAGITLLGENREDTIINGKNNELTDAENLISLYGALEQVTVKFDDQEFDNWNDKSHPKKQGVILFDSARLENCIITNCRNGIYANNVNNVIVSGNKIHFNRTGIQLANSVGATVTNNVITDNETMGILLQYLSVNNGFTPTITGNTFDRNWWSDIDNRWPTDYKVELTDNIFNVSPPSVSIVTEPYEHSSNARAYFFSGGSLAKDSATFKGNIVKHLYSN